MARARGSYPRCHWFDSSCRHQEINLQEFIDFLKRDKPPLLWGFVVFKGLRKSYGNLYLPDVLPYSLGKIETKGMVIILKKNIGTELGIRQTTECAG